MHTSNRCASSCGASENELLLSILNQDAAITVRWATALGRGVIPFVVPVTSNSCSSLTSGLYENILEQRRAIFNALFLG